MTKYIAALAATALILFSACSEEEFSDNVWVISTEDDYLTKAQEAMIEMGNQDTIHFRAGTYMMNTQLSIDGKTGVVIRGEGRESTILDFSEQLSGAQGLLATDMTDVIFADLTIKNPPGDCIKIRDSDGVSFIRIGADYGEADTENGAYGLYPVICKNVWIEDCYVSGASDAGIYVGQSEQVHVSNNYVTQCVAGIEIENCINSDVYGNTTEKNTGGILVFDLPTLPVIKNGNTCRVYDNDVLDNITPNFAPEGNAVGSVPEGTGVMILAFDRVEVFNNRIHGNNVLGVGIVSHLTLEALDEGNTHSDTEYDPYTYNINVHDNEFIRNASYPQTGLIGFLLVQIYEGLAIEPDIVWDGAVNPDVSLDDQKICIDNNGDVLFADVDAVNLFENVEWGNDDVSCVMDPLPETAIDAPTLGY